MFQKWQGGLIAGALATLAILPGDVALALDKVRLGKAVPNSFAFSAAEIGTQAKIFEQEGLVIEVTAFRGDAQLQQGLTAGSLEVGLGSGPGLGFRAKGALSVGVAAMYGAPANLALVIPIDSPIKAPGDLKGKRIGVTTPARSPTGWCASCHASKAGVAMGCGFWRSARCRRGLPPCSGASSTAW
jgi:NitT/TauT family transport system substrate-binding protein